MIVILSPSKTLNYKTDSPIQKYTIPRFLEKSERLVQELQKYSPANLCELMDINNGLGELNYLRFQRWVKEHNTENAKQAIFAFNGEVYNGFGAYSLSTEQAGVTQNTVRILSGLYGVLKPLDLLQPYRLEMGTRLSFESYKNLYSFWNSDINDSLNRELSEDSSGTLINLASNEYSKAARLKEIKGRVITPVFKELKGDAYQIITVYAKKARGLLARFIVDNKIESPEDIKHFDMEGYAFTGHISGESEWVFTR
ncbi:MAG: peroxide stress protein YaaA [Bacteroidales bacterium]|nr:peroxide stress protein YaaA [Bacteroidales bacterium]MBN2818734.1 peroxide stress protein YaaA [Bacteroidales bacterium]